jgi:molecular chaperone DnaK
MQASMKLGEAMYQSQQGSEEGDGAAKPAAADDGVVDAEFEEVGDDQRPT